MYVSGVPQFYLSLDPSSNGGLRDAYRLALAIAALLLAGFLVQGLPYWDCDYSINFRPGYGVSLPRMLLSWISPVYTGVQNWGFLDRTASFIIYKICYLVAGYDSWPYLIVKSICFALLAAMVSI